MIRKRWVRKHWQGEIFPVISDTRDAHLESLASFRWQHRPKLCCRYSLRHRQHNYPKRPIRRIGYSGMSGSYTPVHSPPLRANLPSPRVLHLWCKLLAQNPNHLQYPCQVLLHRKHRHPFHCPLCRCPSARNRAIPYRRNSPDTQKEKY